MKEIVVKVIRANNFGIFLILFFIIYIVIFSWSRQLTLKQVRLVLLGSFILLAIIFHQTSLKIVSKIIRLG